MVALPPVEIGKGLNKYPPVEWSSIWGPLHVAEKDRRRFVGYSGSEVLGLVALWENLGDDWQSKSQSMPNIIPDIVVEEEDEE